MSSFAHKTDKIMILMQCFAVLRVGGERSEPPASIFNFQKELERTFRFFLEREVFSLLTVIILLLYTKIRNTKFSVNIIEINHRELVQFFSCLF